MFGIWTTWNDPTLSPVFILFITTITMACISQSVKFSRIRNLFSLCNSNSSSSSFYRCGFDILGFKFWFRERIFLRSGNLTSMEMASNPRTVEEIFKDYSARRTGLVGALTYGTPLSLSLSRNTIQLTLHTCVFVC